MAGPREFRHNLLTVLGLESLKKMFVFSTKSNRTTEQGLRRLTVALGYSVKPSKGLQDLTGRARETRGKLVTVSVAEEVSK